jgi:hypothetical protein
VLILSGAVDPLSKTGERITGLGEKVAHSADLLIFLGEHCRDDADAAIRAGMDRSRVLTFAHLQEAAEFLKSNLQEGDLVLLRGYLFDHIQRLYFAQLGTVGCWKRLCRRQFLCDHCPELRPGLENAAAVAPPVRPFWQPL